MNGGNILVVGAGPAGLSAAWELALRGRAPLVVERLDKPGGLARTEEHRGYRFDIGGHRFFTQLPEVQALWEEMLGEEFITVPRLSRIYHRGRYFAYPLELFDALGHLGPLEAALILASYLRARVRPYPREESLEHWVTNRFGRRLYHTFFESYTEKVWGIPCSQIRAEWAAQRIRGLSLRSAVWEALGRRSDVKSLVRQFHYPRKGPGQMWERFAQRVEEKGGQVWLNTSLKRVVRDGARVVGAVVERGAELLELPTHHLLSTAALPDLIRAIDPPPPPEVLRAAAGLKFRALIVVGLVLKRTALFPDNWIYIHAPEVKVGRIQNFRNWSADMVPDPSHASVGMEYFCSEGDNLWSLPDEELTALAQRELIHLGLCARGDVDEALVIRQPRAYPVYDGEYRSHLEVLKGWLTGIAGLTTLGRNGMHRYNNQDHSMVMGRLAALGVLGERHDLWEVNTERSYYEDFSR